MAILVIAIEQGSFVKNSVVEAAVAIIFEPIFTVFMTVPLLGGIISYGISDQCR